MSDETRETATSEIQLSPSRPPRQIIEEVVETLRRKDSLSTSAKQHLHRSIKSLDQCIASREDRYAYADAVERAPWLTSDVEHLKRRWSELRQGLKRIYKRDEAPSHSVVDQLNEFAERFVECEAEEQCFLQAAFPGPSWTNESPSF